MRLDLDHLPHDTALLHQLVRDLAERVEQRDGEIEKLRLIVRQLQRGQFGPRSERLDLDQLQLGLEDLDADIAHAETGQLPSAAADKTNREHRPRRLAFPEHLPREEVELDLNTRACPGCGGALHPIGETTSEMLDWVPASLRIIRTRRPKYGCRACGMIHRQAAGSVGGRCPSGRFCGRRHATFSPDGRSERQPA